MLALDLGAALVAGTEEGVVAVWNADTLAPVSEFMAGGAEILACTDRRIFAGDPEHLEIFSYAPRNLAGGVSRLAQWQPEDMPEAAVNVSVP